MSIRKSPSPRAHWVAHFLHTHMVLENMTHAEFLRRSGYPQTMLRRMWNGQANPRVDELENMLGVFGYGIKPSPIETTKEKKNGRDKI